jgi:2-hydroxycyclohexanecarboxyl-CoA dehydrogenase
MDRFSAPPYSGQHADMPGQTRGGRRSDEGDMNYQNKIVLITGAARGIGAEVARQLGAQGAQLVVLDIDGDGATATAATLERAIGLRCDIGDGDAIARIRDQVLERFGRVDLLINNAAAQQFGPGNIQALDLERFRQSFEINVLGCVRMVEAFLPSMRERGAGYIVNTASSLVIRPNPVIQHLMPYVTSKGAVLAWTSALACAVRKWGIDVSLFCPGLTGTRPDGLTIPQKNGWFERTPPELASPGTVQDCAATLLRGLAERRFLISSEPDADAALLQYAAAGLDPDTFSI